MAKGLAVILATPNRPRPYPDDSFDYVILSADPAGDAPAARVLEHIAGIGRRASSRFPISDTEYAVPLMVKGQMPRTDRLPATGNDTANIHFCTSRLRAVVRRDQRALERAVALDLTSAIALTRRVVLESVRRTGRLRAEPRDAAARSNNVTHSRPCGNFVAQTTARRRSRNPRQRHLIATSAEVLGARAARLRGGDLGCFEDD